MFNEKDIQELLQINKLLLDVVTRMDKRIETLETRQAVLDTTANQVSDLHRVKFTPVEKLVEQVDMATSLRSQILSRPPRQPVRKQPI